MNAGIIHLAYKKNERISEEEIDAQLRNFI